MTHLMENKFGFYFLDDGEDGNWNEHSWECPCRKRLAPVQNYELYTDFAEALDLDDCERAAMAQMNNDQITDFASMCEADANNEGMTFVDPRFPESGLDELVEHLRQVREKASGMI